MNKSDFPEELKNTITNLGFDLDTMWLTDEDKKKGVYYLIDEFDVWFPANREYHDFVMVSIEIRRKRKNKSFSIDFIHGQAWRYFRKKNFTDYHSEKYFLSGHEELPNKQNIIELLRKEMFDKHIRVESRRLSQLIASSQRLYDENDCQSRYKK